MYIRNEEMIYFVSLLQYNLTIIHYTSHAVFLKQNKIKLIHPVNETYVHNTHRKKVEAKKNELVKKSDLHS